MDPDVAISGKEQEYLLTPAVLLYPLIRMYIRRNDSVTKSTHEHYALP
jgi:hypothetical protein